MGHVTHAWYSGVRALLGAWVLHASAVASAQAPGPPTFPSEVELITVDAVVVDGKGQPVTGLTKDDFVVHEDGHPRDIVTFESVSVAAEPETAAPAAGPEPFVTNTTKALKKGDRVALVGFGTFSISKRAARKGRNPQTGKEIKIAAKKVVKFKAGADLSNKVK